MAAPTTDSAMYQTMHRQPEDLRRTARAPGRAVRPTSAAARRKDQIEEAHSGGDEQLVAGFDRVPPDGTDGQLSDLVGAPDERHQPDPR